MPSIRIVRCPPGEAPEVVRQAWVGLDLPLAANRTPDARSRWGTDVVSGGRTFLSGLVDMLLGPGRQVQSYAINGRAAVDILEAKDPAAAAWWRTHCAYLLDGTRNLLFPAEVCEPNE